jgi:DNA-binding transcriptional ArsR family regulator
MSSRDDERKFRIKTCLTYSYIGMYCSGMARASTTSDAFNAVAEPRRREILSYLAGAERPVGEIVTALGLEQPSVSKHLRVLRDVGLVRMRCQGRQKLYQTNAEAIRPLHEWAGTFERYWQHQLNRVKIRAEAMIRQGTPDLNSPKKADPNLKEK